MEAVAARLKRLFLRGRRQRRGAALAAEQHRRDGGDLAEDLAHARVVPVVRAVGTRGAPLAHVVVVGPVGRSAHPTGSRRAGRRGGHAHRRLPTGRSVGGRQRGGRGRGLVCGGRGVEEHRDNGVAVVTERRTEQRAVLAASHLGSLALERCLAATLKGLGECLTEPLAMLAGVAQHSEVVLALARSRRHVLGVDANEVLRVAHARPAAVVHIAGAVAARHERQRQAIACVVARLDRRAADGAEAGEHELETLRAHRGRMVEQEARPQVRSCVAVAVPEYVVVLPMQVLHDGARRNGRRPCLAANLLCHTAKLLCKAAERQHAGAHCVVGGSGGDSCGGRVEKPEEDAKFRVPNLLLSLLKLSPPAHSTAAVLFIGGLEAVARAVAAFRCATCAAASTSPFRSRCVRAKRRRESSVAGHGHNPRRVAATVVAAPSTLGV
eukprot:scaffold307_cov63-Phaeocystis_antarctica.AAC.5